MVGRDLPHRQRLHAAHDERAAVAELVAVSRSLEDVFFELTEGEA